jgi:hypothetical protein
VLNFILILVAFDFELFLFVFESGHVFFHVVDLVVEEVFFFCHDFDDLLVLFVLLCEDEEVLGFELSSVFLRDLLGAL